MKTPKVIVFGLDCAPPRLIFDEWRKKLPNISRLMKEGCFGPLRSSDPPITIPAWSCMLSGQSPADLGFYGFKNRKNHSYFELDFVTSAAVKTKRVWDLLGDHGKQSILVGIPQTYPAYPIKGQMVSGFLTPSLDSACTYPAELKDELKALCPDYLFDVPYRQNDKAAIRDALFQMTHSQFKFFDHLLQTKPWDFAMIVQIGTDRLQHAFWADWDTQHPLHDKKSKFKNTMLEYYKKVDDWIGKILKRIDPNTFVLVVSDHGAKPMLGGIAINEWLIQKGYLKLKQYPDKPTSIEKCEIDWPNTTAWGLGGYAARIHLNIQGREPEGKIPETEYENYRQKLLKEIGAIEGLNHQRLNNQVHTPEALYGRRTENAPDLLVYFDDLNYRSLGTVGTKKVAHLENDLGPDGANHDYNGILIAQGPGMKPAKEPLKNLRLFDVATTILQYFGLDGKESTQGKSLLGSHTSEEVFSDQEKTELDEKLRSLGYLG